MAAHIHERWYRRGRGFRHNHTEEDLAAIGDAVMAARPVFQGKRPNTQWKLLEYQFGYSKSVLWRLWKEAKLRKERRTVTSEQKTLKGLKGTGE